MPFQSWLKQIKAQIAGIPLLGTRPAVLAGRVLRAMVVGDTTLMAAGVSFYALFSLFPLLLGSLAIVGLLLNSEEMQQRFIGFVTDNLPGSGDFVRSNLDQILRFRTVLGLGGVLGLFWLGTAVFAAISRAVNRAFGIQDYRPFYIALPRRVVMAIITGSMFLASTVVSTAIQLFSDRELGLPWLTLFLEPNLVERTLYSLPWLITLMMFLMIYRFEPLRKTYWQYVWPGAVVAALLFEASKFLFVWYLENWAVYDQVHADLASVIILLTWIYLSALILTLGAHISYQYELLYRPGAG